eukprot:3406761-Prymnesium_polylepis.1
MHALGKYPGTCQSQEQFGFKSKADIYMHVAQRQTLATRNALACKQESKNVLRKAYFSLIVA